MTTFKKRKLFKDATLYKIIYKDMWEGTLREKEFNSPKSLEQFVSRNDADFGFFLAKRLALVDGEWLPYAIVGNRTLLLDELRYILNDLEDESICKFRGTKILKPKKVKNLNPQKI